MINIKERDDDGKNDSSKKDNHKGEIFGILDSSQINDEVLDNVRYIISEKYGNGDPEKAFEFLISKSSQNFRKDFLRHFSITIFNINILLGFLNIESRIGLNVGDSFWGKVLCGIFGQDVDQINHVWQNITRKELIVKYGNGDQYKAYQYLQNAFQDMKNTKEFISLRIDDKKLYLNNICDIFLINMDKYNNSYEDINLGYELLDKIFPSDDTIAIVKNHKDIISFIIQEYGNGDSEQALQFLVTKSFKWRQGNFKIYLDGNIVDIFKLFGFFDITKQSLGLDNNVLAYKLLQDESWYILLSKIFRISLEKINEIKNNKNIDKLLGSKEDIKNNIIKKYGNGDPKKALQFLVTKGRNWRHWTFKIDLSDNRSKSISFVLSQFLVDWSRKDPYTDDLRYLLLSKVFNKTLEEIDTIRLKSILKESSSIQKNVKNNIIKKYGNGYPEKALQFLVTKGHRRRTSYFCVKVGNNKSSISEIFSIFGFIYENYAEVRKNENWFIFLSKMFDKEVDDIEKIYDVEINKIKEIQLLQEQDRCKFEIIKRYGNGGPEKALSTIIVKAYKWRKENFIFEIGKNKYTYRRVLKLFDIGGPINTNKVRYLFLMKVFDKDLDGLKKYIKINPKIMI